MESLLDLVLPHVAEAYIKISREHPVDPIQFMADFLHERGSKSDESTLNAAREAFYSALDEANAKEEQLLRSRNALSIG